jgi:hypothetical protein
METLNEIFDITPSTPNTEIVLIPKEKPEPDSIDKTLIPDFNTSRDNIDAIMDMGRVALEKVLEIAQEGQHPRFYEAAALLIKNLSDANYQYLELHEKISRIRKNNSESGHNNNDVGKISIKNAIFTGTTADLLKQVNPRPEKKPIVIDSKPIPE